MCPFPLEWFLSKLAQIAFGFNLVFLTRLISQEIGTIYIIHSKFTRSLRLDLQTSNGRVNRGVAFKPTLTQNL